MAKYVKQCHCGNVSIIEVSDEGFAKREYENAKIQVAFPTLSAEKRETIMTGECEPCQKDTFASFEGE